MISSHRPLGGFPGAAQDRTPKAKGVQGDPVVNKRADDELIETPTEPIQFHALAGIFPMLNQTGLRELAQDIAEHGLQSAIVLYEGQILDGRSRYLASQSTARRYQTYTGDDPIGYVLSQNLHRRHLNDTQRAMVGARIANLRVGENQYRDKLGVPTGAAAQFLGVSRRAIARAKFVISHSDRETVDAIENGSLSLSSAEARCRARKNAAARIKPDPNGSTGTDAGQSPSGLVAVPRTNSIDHERKEISSKAEVNANAQVDVSPAASVYRSQIAVSGVRMILGGVGNLGVLVALKLAGAASRGGEWPFDASTKRGTLIWVSAYHQIELTIRTHFKAAGGIDDLLEVLEPGYDNSGLPVRDLGRDLSRISQAKPEQSGVKLAVVDYLSQYLNPWHPGEERLTHLLQCDLLSN
jgi:hypothetical protein